jgi:hypothetical protein
MLVSSARQLSTTAHLQNLIDWLPTLDIFGMKRMLEHRISPPKLPEFARMKPSPLWKNALLADLDQSLLDHPAVEDAILRAASMMQHYGALSDFLDCTESLDVALWFSHHELRTRSIIAHAEDWQGQFYELTHDFCWYITSTAASGMLYVLDVPEYAGSLSDGSFIDLADIDAGVRPKVQRAALVYSDPTGKSGGDLAKFVTIAFQFPIPLAGMPASAQNARTSVLFPGWQTDPLYNHLLDVPFYASDPLDLYRFRRMIRIPYYVDSEANLTDRAWLTKNITRSKFIWPTWLFLEQEMRTLIAKLGQTAHDPEFWLLAAPTCAIVAVDFNIVGGSQASHTFADIDVCLEFAPFETLGIPPATGSRDFFVASLIEHKETIALHRIHGASDLRGVAVRSGTNQGNKGFWYQAFYGWTHSSVRITTPVFFEWTLPHQPTAIDVDPETVVTHTFLLKYVVSLYLSVKAGYLTTEAFPSKETALYRRVIYKPLAMLR